MRIKRKYFIIGGVTILGLLLIRVVLILLGGGSFGLRPASHGCIGLIIESKKVFKIFPPGEFKINFPIYLTYIVPNAQKEIRRVSDAPMGLTTYLDSKYYCLGQDIWLGE